MSKAILCSLAVWLVLAGCSVDYPLKPPSTLESDCIVANSILSPQKPIHIAFYRLTQQEFGMSCVGLRDIHLTLKEDSAILFDDVCTDTILTLPNYYPKAGATYSIEVSHDGLPSVTAQTTIPQPISCEASMLPDRRTWDEVFRLRSFAIPPSENVSLWITAYGIFENDDRLQLGEIYTNSSWVDPVNIEIGMPIQNEYVGSLYYDSFLRIKHSNMEYLEEIMLTPVGVNMSFEHQQMDIKQFDIKLIAASIDYDQYCKNLFRQKKLVVYEDDLASYFVQPTTVYSNIHNGLGIFAGINETDYHFSLPTAP